MSGYGWEWSLFWVGVAYVVGGAALWAFKAWHNKRYRRVLPPPQRQVVRDAYKEHAHAVGNMRGIK